MKIYTKTGDNLTTSIISKRVDKDHIIIECLGTIDEFSASLMVAYNFINDENIKQVIIEIVKEMFDLGGDILKYKEEENITNEKIEKIENIIDEYEAKLPQINDFIIPGKRLSSSHLHLSRTISRRLERRLVTLAKNDNINKKLLVYINRLSDLLYIFARYMEEII